MIYTTNELQFWPNRNSSQGCLKETSSPPPPAQCIGANDYQRFFQKVI